MRTRYDQLLNDVLGGIGKEDIAVCAHVLENSLRESSAPYDLMNLPEEFMDASCLLEDYRRALADSSLKCVISLAMATKDQRFTDAVWD